jgi:hypothetical protein
MEELEPSRNVLCHMNPLSETNARFDDETRAGGAGRRFGDSGAVGCLQGLDLSYRASNYVTAYYGSFRHDEESRNMP